jgi:hypothetical protein
MYRLEQKSSGDAHALSIVHLLVVREPACELASQSPHREKEKTQ